MEILSLEVSEDSNYVAIFAGKQLIKGEELIDCLYIMEKKMVEDDGVMKTTYALTKSIDMVTIGLTDVCKKFYFNKNNSEELIFVSYTKIFKFNIKTEIVNTMYDFENDLKEQPEFFILNDEQDICVIASTADGLQINMNTKTEIDLDMYYGIAEIKKVINIDDNFYIMANKRF